MLGRASWILKKPWMEKKSDGHFLYVKMLFPEALNFYTFPEAYSSKKMGDFLYGKSIFAEMSNFGNKSKETL